MPRKSIPQIDATTGYVRLPTRIPPALWSIAEKIASELKLSQEQALDVVLAQIAAQLELDPSALGPFVSQVWSRLVATDRAPLSGLPPIDFDKLHTSTRTKSGYVGVYANGKGFRAMARQSKANRKLISVGTFPTAERAAWARFLHYKKEQMPYGIVEESIDMLRELMPHLTDAELLEEVNMNRYYAGKEPLSLDDYIGAEEPNTPIKAIGFDDKTDPMKD